MSGPLTDERIVGFAAHAAERIRRDERERVLGAYAEACGRAGVTPDQFGRIVEFVARALTKEQK